MAAVLCIGGYAQTIDPLLSEEMARRGDDEQIKVVVIMKSQYDRTQLCRRADYFVTRAERREFVVNELKAFTTASQYDLRNSLKEMQRNGLTTEPTVLWMSNALAFSATKTAIENLAQRNDIDMIGYAIERNWIPDGEEARPAPSTREITPNVTQVGADQVWDLGYRGEGVVVAVIDTGVNYNHVDLANHLWDGGAEFPHHGFDVYNNDNDPMDDQGHGSHCAGTVCGDGSGASQTGMAPEATLMCVKCLDATGNGGAESISAGTSMGLTCLACHWVSPIRLWLKGLCCATLAKPLSMPAWSPPSPRVTKATANGNILSPTTYASLAVALHLIWTMCNPQILAARPALSVLVLLITTMRLPISLRMAPSLGPILNSATMPTILASA